MPLDTYTPVANYIPTTYGEGLYGADWLGGADPNTITPIPPDPDIGRALGHSPLTIVGSNGDTIPLDLTEADYTALDGATGFGIAPKVLTLIEGAGDGAVVRYVRTGPRDIDVPIGIFGDSRGQVHAKQRRLANAVRTQYDRPSPMLLYTLQDGSVYRMPFTYVSGAETAIGVNGRDYFTRWLLTMRCPQPFWSSIQEATFLVGATSHRGLLPHLARLQVSASQVMGSVDIYNPGDLPAPITWEITGPGGPFTAVSETGESFTLETVLAPGETILVDSSTGTVVDGTGANRYADLGPAPKLFSLPDGTTTVQIVLQGATTASRVVGRYRARLEVVY